MAGKPFLSSILALVLAGVGVAVQAQQQTRTQPPTLLDRLDQFGRNLFDGILPGSEEDPSPTSSRQPSSSRRGTTNARPRYVPSPVDAEFTEEPARAGSISRAAPRNRYAPASEATGDPDGARSTYSRGDSSSGESSSSSGGYRPWPRRSSTMADAVTDYSTDAVRAPAAFSGARSDSVSAGLDKPQRLHERMSAARSSAFSTTPSRSSSSLSPRESAEPEDPVPPSRVLRPVDRAATAAEPAPIAGADAQPPAERSSSAAASGANVPRSLSSESVAGARPRPTPVSTVKSEPTPIVNKPAAIEAPVKPVPVVAEAKSDAETAPSDAADDILLSRQGPNLSVETVGPRRISVGKESTYEITMVNAGEVPAEELLVTVDLPAWADITGSEPSVGATDTSVAGASGRQFQWKIARLGAKSRERITVRIVPRESRPFDLAIKWTYRQSATQTVIEVQEPKLTLSLEGPREVLFGKKEIYRLRVANIGNGDAENTVIKLFPLGSGQSGAASHNFGTVPAGQERSIEVELTARQTGTVAVKVEVSCEGGGQAEISEKVVVRRAALDLEIAGAKRQYVDAPVAYRIRVSNPGSASAADVLLSAEIPESVKFQSASDEGQLESDGRRVRWKIDVLRPGAEKIVELKGTLVRPGPARLEVRCASEDLAAAATAVTEVDAMADLVMDVIDPAGPVAVGQEVTYEVRIQNRGSKAAEELDLVAFFSQGIEPVAVEGGEHRITLGQVAFQKIPSLAPGGEFRAKIRAKAQVPGSHAFRTELECRPQDARLASEKTTFFYGAESGPQVLARSSNAKSGGDRTADRRAEPGTTSR